MKRNNLPKTTTLALATLLLLTAALFAKDKKYTMVVTATQDGSITASEHRWISTGSDGGGYWHDFNQHTNVIRLEDGGVLTVECNERWVWSRCYDLRAGEQYPARFDNKGWVWLLVSKGNLTKSFEFASKAINIDKPSK